MKVNYCIFQRHKRVFKCSDHEERINALGYRTLRKKYKLKNYFYFSFILVVLGIELRVLYLLGTLTLELCP
jgi:hypothetical protein